MLNAQENTSGRAVPTYKLIVGKGYTVCEAYLRNLQAFGPDERDPLCDPRPHPSLKEFSEPAWEPMDVSRNLELVYQAEMSWGIYRAHPERQPPYEQWRQEFEAKIKSGEIHPKLKRARIEFIKGKPETVMAYARNNDRCEAEVAEQGYSDSMGFHWFSYDEESQKVVPDNSFAGINFAGAILLRKGRPYIVNTPLGNDIRIYRTGDKMYAPVEVCRFDIDDPVRPSTLFK